MDSTPPTNLELAMLLRDSLRNKHRRMVLAESCTAGRIAATLGALPGISSQLCGCFVIYRNDSKARWLGIPSELLDDSEFGPVSARVTELLSKAILERTPEADIGLAITGDLGPGAPAKTDGTVFCVLTMRHDAEMQSLKFHLRSPAPQSETDVSARLNRLEEAVGLALRSAVDYLAERNSQR